jgi:GntR family transcriptional regulator
MPFATMLITLSASVQERMAAFKLRSGPVPLHHQVYLHLRDALDSGGWRVGDRLPPERRLAEDYGCSLITVRRALDELVREGRLERARGRGTFVRPRRIVHDMTATWSFTDEMRRRGLEPSTRVVAAVTEPASPDAVAALELEARAPIHRIERLRCANGTPLMLERAHLPADRFPDLLALDLEQGSLYDALVERGVRLGAIHESIEPVILGTTESRLLEVGRNRPALLIEGTTYTEEGEPVEYTITHLPGDRSRIYLESRGMRARSLVPLGTPDTERGEEAGRPLAMTGKATRRRQRRGAQGGVA